MRKTPKKNQVSRGASGGDGIDPLTRQEREPKPFSQSNAAEQAEKMAAQLRLLVEAAPNGMVMVNTRGEIIMVNAQMERLFGCDRSRCWADPWKCSCRSGTAPCTPETRAMGHGRDLFARRKDGSEFSG
jgi:transcriptional regulator with PAS, ATPase and Fis domain